jgi:hypothetical protein
MVTVDPLVTLTEAKRHLRKAASDTSQDADIQMKLDQATAIIIDYLKDPDHGWDVDTVPLPVHAAILLQLGDLYTYRGDERAERDDELAPGVASLLRRMRDPALA